MSTKADFKPIEVAVFMGGDFDLGRPQTVGELRRILAAMDEELAGWGDDEAKIAEVWGTVIRVTLEEGIAQ